MKEDLHALKFTNKEEPHKLALRIAKNSMKYKKRLSDQHKAAHIMRLGKANYTDVLCAEEGPVAGTARGHTPVRRSLRV